MRGVVVERQHDERRCRAAVTNSPAHFILPVRAIAS
jgi:hypothetical protein